MTLTQAATAGLGWRRPTDHRALLARGPTTVGLSETARLASTLPLLFAGETKPDRVVVITALPGQPSPFLEAQDLLHPAATPERIALAPFTTIDTDHGPMLAVDALPEALSRDGLPFHDAQGHLTDPVAGHAKRLSALARDEARARLAVTALAQAGCLAPVREGSKPIQGLWNVAPNALSRLQDREVLHLFRLGALALAQTHLVSLGHLARLGQGAPGIGAEPSGEGFLSALASSFGVEAS